MRDDEKDLIIKVVEIRSYTKSRKKRVLQTIPFPSGTKEYKAAHYQANKEWYSRRHSEYKDRNPKDAAQRTKIYETKIRLKVLRHYSGSEKPFCKCCGESTYEFLAVDHINNGRGNPAERSGGALFRQLLREGFPKGFQILCHNCNTAKGHYGKCPHPEIYSKWII